ncbi:MAG: SMC-Scp complex subunit ScpB [Bryobacteraceae bacterium]
MKKKKKEQASPAEVETSTEAVEQPAAEAVETEAAAEAPVSEDPAVPAEPAAAQEPAGEAEAADIPAAEGSAPEAQAPEMQASEAPVQMDAEQAAEQFEVETKADASETDFIRMKAMLEAIVYVLEEPLGAAQIAQALGQPKEVVEKALADLVAETALPGRGLQIREVAGGFKMSTKAEFHEEIRTFVKKLKPTFKLSQAALETLAVIAYKQPITAPEILEIRGVQGGGVLKTLLERKLVTTAGRKQVVGKPVLYKTTKEFLVQFGLRDVNELPTLKEFEEWSRLAIEEANAEANAEAEAGKGPAEPEATVEAAASEPAATPETATPEATTPEAAESDAATAEPAAPDTAEPESPATADTALEHPAPENPSPENPTPEAPIEEAPIEEAQPAMPEEPQTNTEDSPDKPPPEILDGAVSSGDDAGKPPPEILDGAASTDAPKVRGAGGD